ncbi:MAG: hypothetical protein Q9226_000284 [Calogaya cf. arnoldii]
MGNPRLDIPSTALLLKRNLSIVDDDQLLSNPNPTGLKRKGKRSRRSDSPSVLSISSGTQSDKAREGIIVGGFQEDGHDAAAEGDLRGDDNNDDQDDEDDKTRPPDGCTFIQVAPANIKEWVKYIEEYVKLEELGITFIINHKDFQHRPLAPYIKKLRTVRDMSDPNTKFPPSKAAEHPAAFGLPTPESTSFIVLTTYQTWDRTCRTFESSRNYHHQVNRQKVVKTDKIMEFQCGFAIVDESHRITTPGSGHWRALERMRKDRPYLRFWSCFLSGTMLHTSPKDLAAAISIISSLSWQDERHTLYPLRVDRLKEISNLLETQGTDPSADEKTDAFVDAFKRLLHRVLIRRNENSTWFKKSLIDLKPLEMRRVNVKFPEEHRGAHDSLVAKWTAKMKLKLAKDQAEWDKNQHRPAYRRDNPVRPDSLASGTVFSSSNARRLRLTSTLPSLAANLPKYADQIWRNKEIVQNCLDKDTGTMKSGCVLDQEWGNLRKDPKIVKMLKVLADHHDKPFLILSFSAEVLLLCERAIRESGRGRWMAPYFGTQKSKTGAKDGFRGLTNAEGKLIHPVRPDGLGGTTKTLGTGHNLTQAKVIILMEPVYESYLWTQIPKRAHRYGQTEKMFFYTLFTDTKIEDYVNDRRIRKDGFGEKAFARLAEMEELEARGEAERKAEEEAIKKATEEKALQMEV